MFIIFVTSIGTGGAVRKVPALHTSKPALELQNSGVRAKHSAHKPSSGKAKAMQSPVGGVGATGLRNSDPHFFILRLQECLCRFVLFGSAWAKDKMAGPSVWHKIAGFIFLLRFPTVSCDWLRSLWEYNNPPVCLARTAPAPEAKSYLILPLGPKSLSRPPPIF